MKTLNTQVLATALSLVFAACSSAPERTEVGTSSAALTSSDPAGAVAGTWTFALDASDVAKKFSADCESRSGGDKAKKDACYEAIRAEGATEKVRFTTDAAGHTVWTSFGQKGDKEELFLEVPVELASESPTAVLAKVAGASKGAQVAEMGGGIPVGTIMRIELVDAHTLVMVDPHKGRLVYGKD